MLVPGLLCTEDLFAPQVAGLADVVDVVVGDHTRHDSMTAIAADILEHVPKRFVLGGLSMGGYIAFEMLRQAPERVQALILMDTNARADREQQKQERQAMVELGVSEGLDPVLDAFVPLMVHPDRLSDTSLIGCIRQMGYDTGVEAYTRQQVAIIGRRDNRKFLGQIDCPTVVIVGAQDVVTPAKVAQEMANGIAGARLEIVPECGHLPTLEKPDIITGIVRNFLAEI